MATDSEILADNFKPTWLMIKQHNVTGLKYFCKTTKKNPYTYKGSGQYWAQHLAKHRSNITTTWCELFTDKDMLVEFALFFSEEFNIVQSSDWANLIVENGCGGGYIPNKGRGRVHSPETRALMSASQTGRKVSELSKANMSVAKQHVSIETRNKIGAKHKGKVVSQATKDKMSDSAKKKPSMSDSTRNKIKVAAENRTHTRATKDKISAIHKGKVVSELTKAKMSASHVGKVYTAETLLKFKNRTQTQITRDKISAARLGKHQPLVVCTYCNTTGGAYGMKRYHFDNCKYKGLTQ